MKKNLEKPEGRLGILLPGMGAVATTFMAGVFAVRKGISQPIGSYTQMGSIRLGKRTEDRSPKINEFVHLANLNDIVFGGWDIFEDNAYEAAMNAGVLEKQLLNELKPELSTIVPMKAVFDKKFVHNLDGINVKKAPTKMDLAQELMKDIADFKQKNDCSRLVMVWCASTEAYIEESEVHQNLSAFEDGLLNNHPNIAPSMIYAYAAIKSGVPYANGAPNLSCDFPAMIELAKQMQVPICGKDFKTGQTLMKTIIAPGLKARNLGVNGWFSPIYSVIAMAKFLMILKVLKLKKYQNWEVSITYLNRNSILNCITTFTTRSELITTRQGVIIKKAGII